MKAIKAMFVATIVSISLVSCKKDDIQPTPQQQCNCGVITDDDIVISANGNYFYSLTIQNNCSGNLATYYFSQEIWMNAHIGESFCVTNVSSWLPEGTTTIVEVENKEIK